MLDDIYLRLFLEIMPNDLKMNSLDVRRLIEQHNEGHHSHSLYGELIKHVYEQDPESTIGLKYGQFLWPSTLCDFSRTLMTADNLGTSIKLIEQYHYILGTSYYPRITRKKGKVSIAITFPYKKKLSIHQRRFCTESLFSYMANTLKETIDQDAAPSLVCFDSPAPSYQKDYKKVFGERLLFNMPLNTMEIDESLLKTPFKTANPTLHHMYLNKCLDHWRSSERLQEFEYRVITYLMLHHPESFVSQNLANKLNISVRGLQKRLNKHGGSFSNLANLARRELAKVYLFQDNQTIDFTAEQLGFQTTSGFRRFFKTEFDQTPAEYISERSDTTLN